ILHANPQVRGMLIDRQEAVDGARLKLSAVGIADRCQFVGGDLLESVPQGADAYVMKYVLHGYDDESARRILNNCRAAMTQPCRLLIIESVLPERIDQGDPQIEKIVMSDLNMLAVTSGRERSEVAWAGLLSSSGFMLRLIIRVPGSTVSIIEAGSRE